MTICPGSGQPPPWRRGTYPSDVAEQCPHCLTDQSLSVQRCVLRFDQHEAPQPANPNYNAEPIINKDADGYFTLVWSGPDSCLVAREVLEGFVNDHNRMRLMLANLGAAIEEL